MRALILLPFAVILALLAAVTIEPGVASTTAPTTSSSTAEIRRIRAHFDSALTELAARDVRSLTGTQRAERTALLRTLRAYRDRGVFPHNYDFPDRATPYFVDRVTGTRCAVAHLLASTGREDIVGRVARSDNNVRVADLASDTAFTGWLSAHGLSLAEAARIQVPYMAPASTAERTRNVVFLTAAPIALGGSVVASLWNAGGNADGHHRVANLLGLTSGVMAIGMGTALIGKPDVPRGIGITTAALGSVSVALATRAIRRHSVDASLERDAKPGHAAVETSLAPIVPSGRGGGLALSIRF